MIELKQVRYEDLSAIKHTVFVSLHDRISMPEFLVIRYEGVYRVGGAGHDDALFIVATAEAARRAWYAQGTILDLRELDYSWGDEMEWLTGIGWNKGVRFHEPLAIVVGEKCKNALQSLLRKKYAEHCFDDIEAAYQKCRERWLIYKEHIKNFNASVPIQ